MLLELACRRYSLARKAHLVGLLLCVGSIEGCDDAPENDHELAAQEQELSFEQYLASLPRTPGGAYVVESDIAVSDVEHVRALFAREQAARNALAEPDAEEDEVEGTSQPLIVSRVVNGMGVTVDNTVDSTQRLNIRYCVSNAFTTHNGVDRKATVVAALQAAATQWENASKLNGGAVTIDFIYDSGKDATCSSSSDVAGSYFFDVQPSLATTYHAQSFLPSTARSSRTLLVSHTAYSPGGSMTFNGIILHELGHVIGLMHEHVRPRPGCAVGSWRAIGPYDNVSVMHYPGVSDTSPTCDPDTSRNYVMTSYDIAGTRCLYNTGYDACKGTRISTAASLVAADNNGVVYRVNSGNTAIERYMPPTTWGTPGWTTASTVSNTGALYAGGTKLYRKNNTDGKLYRWVSGSTWTDLGTAGSAVVVSYTSGNAFRLNSNGTIDRVTSTGTVFSSILGTTAAGRTLFPSNDEVFRRESNGDIYQYFGGAWTLIATGFSKIAVDRSDNFFGLDSSGALKVYTSSWVTYATGIANIYGGMDGYFVSPTASPSSVRRWSTGSGSLKDYALNVSSIVTGGPRRLIRTNGAGGTTANEIWDYLYPTP